MFSPQDMEDTEYEKKELVEFKRKSQPRSERTVAVTVKDNSAAE